MDIASGLIERISQADASGRMSSSMEGLFREHVANRYPGSSHWSPDKVNAGHGEKNEGVVEVDIPGATRAYHDIDILPIHGEFLTIPISLGVSYSRDELFRPEGRDVLAVKRNGSLVAVLALVKEVHQERDESLLPSDGNVADAAMEGWLDALCRR